MKCTFSPLAVRIVASLLLALSLLLANSVSAQRIGVETAADDVLTTEQTRPVVASLTNGGFVVAWEGQETGSSNTDVYARLFDASGSAVGSTFLVNTTVAPVQIRPTVTGLAGGGFVVGWISVGQLQPGNTRADVFARVFDASGAATTGEIQMNAIVTGDQVEPVLVATASGFAVAIQGHPGSGWGVYVRGFLADGTPVTSQEFQVSAHLAPRPDESRFGSPGKRRTGRGLERRLFESEQPERSRAARTHGRHASYGSLLDRQLGR